MKKLLPLTFLLILHTCLFAQIPAGYYDGTSGLYGDNLKSTLHSIIEGHTEYDYDYVDELLKNTDEDPTNSANVILLYTGRSQSKSSFGGGVNDWNREHVWAKSHGDFGTSKPCGSDLHHMKPTDASVNSSRGSLDFDNGGSYHSEATECKSDNDSWEPRDDVKGDIARMMFYMCVRYEGTGGELDLELVDYTGTGTAPNFGKLSTLLQWHADDPVDQFEIDRNDAIYGYQNNRNPFIDHPEFVSEIWEHNSIDEQMTKKITVSVYPNPAKDVLYINAPNFIDKKMTITFINAIGQPVKTVKDVTVARKNTIRLHDLQRGAYFVKFVCGDYSWVERLVVDR